MPTFKRPDVFVQEVLAQPNVGSGVSADALPTLIGESLRGPVTPTIVQNWTEFQRHFGSFTDSTYLSFAAYQYFVNGGGALLVARPVSATAVAATRTFLDTTGVPVNTLRLDAKNPGAWGNSIYVSITAGTGPGKFDLVVKYGGTGDGYIVEKYSDLSVDSTNSRYAPTYIATYSDYVVATDLNSASPLATRAPAAQTDQALATGANGGAIGSTEYATLWAKLELVDQVLVCAYPGVVDATTLSAAINSAAASGRRFIIVDAPAFTSVGAYATFTATLPTSDYAAVYGPWIKITDPSKTTNTVVKTVPPSGSVLGRFASVDATDGVFRTPAGPGEGVIKGAVDVEKVFAAADLDTLNTQTGPVNVVRPLTNRGVTIMGGRTLNQATAAKYVSNRRSLIYIREALRDACGFAVFEPNDENLWDSLVSACTEALDAFHGAGGLRGTDPSQAYFVVCDSSNNTALSVANGEVNVNVGVALEYPAEFVNIKVGLFEGGANASEVSE